MILEARAIIRVEAAPMPRPKTARGKKPMATESPRSIRALPIAAATRARASLNKKSSPSQAARRPVRSLEQMEARERTPKTKPI
jgi:hypothetical protein